MSEFTKGYNAAALDQPRSVEQSADWKRGWDQYHADMTRSENCRWA